MIIPLIRPKPPSLRELGSELLAIESSGIYSNYGPINTSFEQALAQQMFDDTGACVTVCNATIGLMMAIRTVLEQHGKRPHSSARRFALMPSFTFAAAAHAAEWLGLTPLFCDIDTADWTASAGAEEEMIRIYGDDIAVIVPYATFGNSIDLDRYERLSARTGIPIVVDAAASLGSLDVSGRPFGQSCSFPVVFSMHATKTFSTGEGGVIYSADRQLVNRLRIMGNFGFGHARSATMPGLNSKLSEVGALLALARLRDFEAVVRHREELAVHYRGALPGWQFQAMRGQRCAYQFMPLLPPDGFEGTRASLIKALEMRGIGAAAYFSPHLAEQPFFQSNGVAGDLSVTERVSARILALPLWDEMTPRLVDAVCNVLLEISATGVVASNASRPVSQPRPGSTCKPLLRQGDAS